jgi:hypothetical protein
MEARLRKSFADSFSRFPQNVVVALTNLWLSISAFQLQWRAF